MDKITARATAFMKGVVIFGLVFFSAGLVVSICLFFVDAGKHPLPPLVVLIMCVAYVAFVSLLLRALQTSYATYEADEVGCTRYGWRGPVFLRWDEIARYRVSTRAGDLTYIFYDHAGQRRSSIDFQLLGRNGERLFALMNRKLREVLPDQEHKEHVLPHLRGRPRSPADLRRVRRNGKIALAVVLALSLPGVWVFGRHMQLLHQGQLAPGVVLRLRSSKGYDVLYRFSTEYRQECVGWDSVTSDVFEKLQVGRPVVVRYLPRNLRVNELENGIRWRGPAIPSLMMLGLCVFHLAALRLLRRWAQKRRASEGETSS